MAATKILNRETFLEFLNLEVKRAQRYQNFFSIITLRILGSIKKKPGKPEGCYVNLLRWLKDEVRETDVLASMGENQIAVLLPYAGLPEGSCTLSRIQDSLKFFDFEKEGYTVKINQICFPEDGTETGDLIGRF